MEKYYAFEIPDVPAKSEYLEVKYSVSIINLMKDRNLLSYLIKNIRILLKKRTKPYSQDLIFSAIDCTSVAVCSCSLSCNEKKEVNT